MAAQHRHRSSPAMRTRCCLSGLRHWTLGEQARRRQRAARSVGLRDGSCLACMSVSNGYRGRSRFWALCEETHSFGSPNIGACWPSPLKTMVAVRDSDAGVSYLYGATLTSRRFGWQSAPATVFSKRKAVAPWWLDREEGGWSEAQNCCIYIHRPRQH